VRGLFPGIYISNKAVVVAPALKMTCVCHTKIKKVEIL
jgi:hypothetical protein